MGTSAEATMGTSAGARPAARGKCPRVASVSEAAERTGMHAGKRAAMSDPATAGMIDPRASTTETVAISESPAVGDVRVMVVNQAVSVPIRSPAVPPPAETTEETDTNSQAEPDPRSIEEKARNPNPTRIEREGITVDDPGVVFRHINDLRICWFNHDRISLGRDGFLLRALQVPGLLRSPAHHLNRVEDILLPVHVRLPE